jgi:hypothetical protein
MEEELLDAEAVDVPAEDPVAAETAAPTPDADDEPAEDPTEMRRLAPTAVAVDEPEEVPDEETVTSPPVASNGADTTTLL